MELSQFGRSFTGASEQVGGAAVGTLGAATKLGKALTPDKLEQQEQKVFGQTPQGRAMIQGAQDVQSAGPPLQKAAGEIYRHGQKVRGQREPGIWNYIQDVTGQTLPLMMGSMAAGAAFGPIGAFAVGFASEGEAAYQEARIGGASEQHAQAERVIVGSLNGVIEFLQANQFLKLGKEGVKPLVDAAKRRAWKEVVKAGGKLVEKDVANAASEGLEETLQEAVSIGAATIHGDTIEISDWKKLTEAGVGGFTAGLILGGPSVVRGTDVRTEGPIEQGGGTQAPVEAVRPSQVKPEPLPTALEAKPTEVQAPPTAVKPKVAGVALLLDDGSIIKGPGKAGHIDIVGELSEDRNVVDAGFLDEAGNYLYRDDVLETPQAHAARPTSPTVIEKETPAAQEHTKAVEPPTEVAQEPTIVRPGESTEVAQGPTAVSPPGGVIPPTPVSGDGRQRPGVPIPPPESVGPQGPALPPGEPPTPVSPMPGEPQGPTPVAPGKGAVKGKVQSLYQDVLNRFASLEDLSKRAKKLGLKLKPGENPGYRARSYLGVGNKVKSTLEDATFRTTPEGKIEKTGEGYKPILDDFDKAVGMMESSAKLRAKDLQDYEVAQRTILDLQRPAYEGAQRNIVSPGQVAAAQKTMAVLQAKYGKALQTFGDIFQRRIGYRARILHLLVDSGNLSQQQYDKIVAENPHYVPFDRVMDEVETSAMPRAKKPFTQARSPVRKIKGSERDVENTTESDIKNTYRIMDTAERNTVARSVAGLAESFPEDISPVHVKMVPIKVHPEEIETVRREFRTKVGPIVEEVRTGGGATQDATGPMAKLETVVREALMSRGMTEGEAGSYLRKLRSGGPVTSETIERTVKEAEQILISEEPVESTIFRPSQFMPKGRVIEYFQEGKRKYIEVTKNLYDAMTGMNEASLGLLTKIMATPANLLRSGATLTPEFIVRNPIRDQWTAMMNTQVGFIPFLDTARAVADVVGKSEVYEDWLRSGGSHSGFVELSRPQLQKAVKELTRPSSWKLLTKLNIVSDLRYLSQLFEQATRVGVYKKAVRAGQTGIEAGYTSREGTTDFARRGSKTKDINAMVAFFNAGVQGLDRSIRAAKADPVGFTIKGLATLTVPSLLLYLRNRKEDDWEEIPRWQRDLFWCFKVGDTWYRIPKPFLYGQIFGSVPERVAEYIDKKDPAAFKELAASLYDSLSPVSGDPAGGLLPTAVRPIIENETNWNFFRDRPVVGESRQDLLPPYQHNRYTTETAKELGKFFNYSPAKIENLVQGWFGGSGQYALQGGDMLLNAIREAKGEPSPGKRPAELADVPLAKGFAVRPPESGQAESIRAFYDESATLTAKYSTWRRLAMEGNTKDAEKLFTQSPELLFATETSRSREDITEHGKEIDRISASTTLSAAQKKEMIRTVEKKRMASVKEANAEIARLKSDPTAVLTALMALRDRSTYKEKGKTVRDGKPVGHHLAGQAHPGLESLVEIVNAEILRRQGGGTHGVARE
jgi:hypothetical protein